jgi:Tol biopolymer transport system component
MKNSQNIGRRLFVMTWALAGLLSWNVLLICSPTQAAGAASSQAASQVVANGKIAFNRDGDIFTMNADGSDLKQLAFGGAGGALWSPDGTKIAFGRSTGQICVMDADGSNQKCLTPSGGDLKSSAWSPDSMQIAFVTFKSISLASPSGGGLIFKEDIYAMNAGGSNERSLTNSDLNEIVSSPSWSPDGMKIAFSRSKGNSHTVRVMNADGSNQRDILNGYSYRQAWSPDGSKLLVSPSGMKGIWVVNPDGGGLTKVHESIPSPAYPNVYDWYPVWSPDGSKLAFSTLFCDSTACLDDFGAVEVIVVNADGSHPTQGVSFDQYGFGFGSITWSPDGTKIIFDQQVLVANPGLFVMNADGSGVTNVTNGSGGSEPSWQAVPLIPSAIDDTQFFVRQHYRDFLNRDPDADGLAFWTNEILSCGGDAQCIDAKRINVSAAYFLSIEFQQTGYLVYRFYKASYGNAPGAPVPLRLNEFLPDTREIGQGVVVNQPGWEQLLESNKQAFATEFVQRSRFTSAYPTSMSSEQFVDALFANAGVIPSASDRTADINEFAFGATTNDVAARARALRRVAENSTLAQQEFNRAFVLMQYFGYLRRNPNDAPDGNFDGYNFWLNKLNSFNGNFIDAEMVKAFLSSSEYRLRFGS